MTITERNDGEYDALIKKAGIGQALKVAPNPYGALGKPDHQKAVQELEELAIQKYPNSAMYKINKGTTIKNQTNTNGLNRNPDVWVEERITGKVIEVFEAGRESKNGYLASREAAKIVQYRKFGIKYIFKLLPK